MILFLIIALAVFFLGHIYLAWRINWGFSIVKPYTYIIYGFFLLMALTMLATQFGMRNGFLPIVNKIAPIGFFLMGFFALAICVFILNDILNLINFLIFKIKMFKFYSTVVAVSLTVLASIIACINFSYFLDLKEVRIKVSNLNVPQYRIALIADIHINKYTKPEKINKIFDRVLELNPDMIIIAGDIIDTDINANDKYLEYGFTKLTAPDGVFVISGNHEYYTGIKVFYDMFAKLPNIKVLNDENVLVDNKINIAGINDINYHNPELIWKVLDTADPKYPTVFVSHRPDSFDFSAALDREIVQLSGHTHAGQIPPVWIVIKFFMKYWYGVYTQAQSTMYITSGAVGWGPPMRLFNCSEIALIILEPK
jgi:predicted MPP superfamily phosphohydrolase